MYVEVIVRPFEAATGKSATLAEISETFQAWEMSYCRKLVRA